VSPPPAVGAPPESAGAPALGVAPAAPVVAPPELAPPIVDENPPKLGPPEVLVPTQQPASPTTPKLAAQKTKPLRPLSIVNLLERRPLSRG
jgi:hypothetical protein